jgi:hypothetical protein
LSTKGIKQVRWLGALFLHFFLSFPLYANRVLVCAFGCRLSWPCAGLNRFWLHYSPIPIVLTRFFFPIKSMLNFAHTRQIYLLFINSLTVTVCGPLRTESGKSWTIEGGAVSVSSSYLFLFFSPAARIFLYSN